MPRFVYPAVAALTLAVLMAQAPQTAPLSSRLTDPFASGWMLADTNGDGIADFINGKIIVPANPSAAENAAAANFAARVAYGSTGHTPPLVMTAAGDRADGPRIWIG